MWFSFPHLDQNLWHECVTPLFRIKGKWVTSCRIRVLAVDMLSCSASSDKQASNTLLSGDFWRKVVHQVVRESETEPKHTHTYRTEWLSVCGGACISCEWDFDRRSQWGSSGRETGATTTTVIQLVTTESNETTGDNRSQEKTSSSRGFCLLLVTRDVMHTLVATLFPSSCTGLQVKS